MRFIAIALMCMFAAAAQAQLTIEITKGIDNPVPIAVVPFGWRANQASETDMASIIEYDLKLSGAFAPMQRSNMLGMPQTSADVFYRDWRSLGMDYVLVGSVRDGGKGQLEARYELMDVNTQKVILSGTQNSQVEDARGIAHAVSDSVYEKLTNIRGAFNTKLLYVSARREGNGKFVYSLLVSDIDGARERAIISQSQPIMTPGWSPDGKNISYVSFETTRPAVYVHNLETGRREQLTNFRGLNGSPVWSPDGKKLAMVLSKDGSPDIYVIDLRSRRLTRVTRHFAIDTEPSWMPDGRSLIFTSDRGGRPQIYKVELATGKVQRLTFDGDYNARARVLPSGLGMVLVHRDKGEYRIARMLFEDNSMEILTDSALDESPSVAPNGNMLLYATKHNKRGVLAAVSLDGDVQYRLPSRFGDVREPAWSPFLD